MKKLLLSITMLSLIGCGEVSAEKTIMWNDSLILSKNLIAADIYISSKGNCYFHGFRSFAKVDCEDFNVEVSNPLTKDSKPATDSPTALLEYIRDYCVEDDKYKDFPRVEGTSVIKELQGKQLSCKLPDNIDSSLNERAEYLRLKKKFGG